MAPALRLHLMMPELALGRGRPCPAEPALTGEVATPELALLAGFLSSSEARCLEQEALDPVPLPDLRTTGQDAAADRWVDPHPHIQP